MRAGLLGVVLFLEVGCGVTGFEDIHIVSDSETTSLVEAAPYPGLVPPIAPASERPDIAEPLRLDLRECLRLALRNNLPFLVEGERIDVQLLSLLVLRRQWGPSLGPLTGSVTYGDSPETAHSSSESLSTTLSQKMPYGGSVSATWTHTGSQLAGPDAYQGTGILSYTQPLLRGAGRRVAWEEMVSAERGYVYSMRQLEFDRQSLLVGTVEAFFGLRQQEQNIVNFERNLERSRRLARLADINEKFGRVTRTDVFRSQLEVTRAEGSLSEARSLLRLARDAFKIDLGLRPEREIELVPEKIDYRPLQITSEDAVASALERNPAWLTARDRREDARRTLANAETTTLPKVDMTAAYTWQSDAPDEPAGGYALGSRSWSVTAAVELPLDRAVIDRDYQAAVITYRQVERDFIRARDRLIRDVQANEINLRKSELAMEFQKRAIVDAEKAGRLAEFDYRRGRATNRDVIEAQDRLLEAQNAYQSALVSARIQQLRLLQFIGKLEVDEEGRWLK